MKALILAAGLGTRLAPITDDHPKCMTEVIDGKTIIQNQIENIRACGIDDITVITGYKSNLLKNYINSLYSGINFIESINYNSTNNMYSAFLAKDVIKNSEFLMMNADVFFDKTVLKSLIDFYADDAIVVDIGTYMEESMKVVEMEGKLVQIAKTITPDKALGSSIDIYKFSVEGGNAFFNKCDEYINGKKELKLWSEVAINDILKDCNFKACPLNGRWYEIDTHEDLENAKLVFSMTKI